MILKSFGADICAGFVRSYARLLHLDETVCLTLTINNQAARSFKKARRSAVSDATISPQHKCVWLSAALGLAVILGLGVLFFHDRPAKKPDESKPVVAVR